MKRRVALLALILMFSVGMAITVSAAGESAGAKWWEEIDWEDLLQNKVVPAAEVRAIRDKLLADSDKEMVLDRVGLEVPTGVSFTAQISLYQLVLAII